MFVFRKYNTALETRPLLTKCLTSFCMFGIGDIISQKIEGKKLNKKRFLIQASFGFFAGFYFHLQFCKIMPKLFPASAKYSNLKSVLYDQTVGAVIFTSGFFMYLDLMAGMNFETVKGELKKKLPPTIIDTWKVWPLLMYINFTFVPLAYRVLYSNVCGMFWAAYLSYVSNVKSKRMQSK